VTMFIDYEKIRTDNIREYGEGTRHLSFLKQLYTDRTHFIFELLQNAEDAGATHILFHLFENRLEVTHNGRIFNEQDVIGICGVGDGTKSEDFTQIGKFGIGFKSVYAYTETPEIYSGDEGFKIENYVRPYSVVRKQISNSVTTLFVLPFNNEKVPPKTACKEIGDRLRNLNARTLLFLRKISKIEFRLPDSTEGVYLREEVIREPARQVSVIGKNNGRVEKENWLVFERPVKEPSDESLKGRVEVGFRMEITENDEEKNEKIVKSNDSSLVVFFPTKKDTKLGFLVQGPYKTTPSRDFIPDVDQWNVHLVRETAKLLVDILPVIKELGLLTISFLEALPINSEDFPIDSMFYPLFDSLRNTLRKGVFIPANDGSYITAESALLADTDWLRSLLKYDQRKLLFQKEKKWIHRGINLDLKIYFNIQLDVQKIDSEEFARMVDESFFKEQSDQWMIDFYKQLSKNESLWKHTYYWREVPLEQKPFIRLQDGSHIKPFDDNHNPLAYLPGKKHLYYQAPTVKAEIASNEEAYAFLKDNLKIPEFNQVYGVIDYVLSKYDKQSSENLPEEDEHLRDIKSIMDAYDTDSIEEKNKLRRKLKETPFILSQSNNSNKYCKPNELYIADETLEMYFEGNPEVRFVSPIYENAALEMFTKLGVQKQVRIEKKDANTKGHVSIRAYHGYHTRGLQGFDPDIKVDGLENALATIIVKKSLFIWNEIVIPNASCIKGTIEESTRQTFEDRKPYIKVSEFFGELLINRKWLPGKEQDVFCCPGELSLDDLPADYERNEKVADLLGMKKNILAKIAEEINIPVPHLEYIKNHPEEIDRLISKSEMNASKNIPSFPIRTVKDPQRRQERLHDNFADSPNKKFEMRFRSMRTTGSAIDPITWLRNEYTNDNDQMVCQICKLEMPFRKRDGKHYFEKKEILSRDDLPKEQNANYLALCPICAAKYKEFIDCDDLAKKQIKEKIINFEDCEIPITLGDEETSIRFVATHYHDLKAIIKELQ